MRAQMTCRYGQVSVMAGPPVAAGAGRRRAKNADLNIQVEG
jgi:hypothetical protein